MEIYPIDTLLTEEGFSAAPPLRALNPNQDNYKALLFQPMADILADAAGVRHSDSRLADRRFTSFLEMAVKDQADLVITPEYSMPWETLKAAILNGTVPATGSLWVLGCESTTLDSLAEFKDHVEDVATVLYEPLSQQTNRFVDPVLYVFVATTKGVSSTERLVIVVQFKTSRMGGKEDDYEKYYLQTGNRIYHFGSAPTQLGLATLICSDAFAITDQHAKDLYFRTLLLHIQLNKRPRQAQYSQYREKFFQFAGDQTEILCLNWAQGVNLIYNGQNELFTTMSGSAWYLRPDKFDNEDKTIKQNHDMGLYYTWWAESKCHVLYFAYCDAVYSVSASKVAYHGVIASQARRTGPTLTSTKFWDSGSSEWVESGPLNDGFSAIVGVCGIATSDIAALATINPLYAERSLALCAGAIPSSDWYKATILDSCLIDRSEIVFRVTACQDTDQKAKEFRTLRLRSALRMANILERTLPPALSDLSDGYKFDWSPEFPHTNVISTASCGDQKRATVIFLGDQHSLEAVVNISKRAADHIGLWAKNMDQIVDGKQRIGVWFIGSDGNVVQLQNPYVEYDKPQTESPFDIGSES